METVDIVLIFKRGESEWFTKDEWDELDRDDSIFVNSYFEIYRVQKIHLDEFKRIVGNMFECHYFNEMISDEDYIIFKEIAQMISEEEMQ